MFCSRCGERMVYPGPLVDSKVSLICLLHKIRDFCLTVWKNHMSTDVTEPVRMVFTRPIHFYTYLDIKREIEKLLKITHGPVFQK